MEKCDADNLLKVSNTVKTEARETLLKFILESDHPVTANYLHNRIKDSGTDLATVYRALKVFVDKGLVRTVNADSTQVFYEKSCVHSPLHPHFYCEKCGKIECMNPFGFNESKIIMKMGGDRDIDSVEVILRGRCRECAG